MSITPIFTGGTGRSGTTIIGAMLGHHSQVWATFPREIRFLTDRFGLLDLTIGGTTPSRMPNVFLEKLFLHNLQHQWWHRVGPDGAERGLHRGIPRANFDSALEAFGNETHSIQRAQTLVSDLMDPVTRSHGASMWVDTSPANAMNADRILSLIPHALVIHVVRDGRDACASVVTKAWGPTRHMKALEWWRKRMLLSHRGISRAPQSKTLTLVLEDLLLHRREESYKELIRFLGLNDEEEMHTFFSERMTSKAGHLGRWRSEVPRMVIEPFSRRYEEIWHELSAQQVPLPPLN